MQSVHTSCPGWNRGLHSGSVSVKQGKIMIRMFYMLIIHSFIHSGYSASIVYSASSSPLILKVTPDTARILCKSLTPKRHSQL